MSAAGLKNLNAAWARAQSPGSAGSMGGRRFGFLVTKREFGQVVAAAKKDDGKLDRQEAEAIVYRSSFMYTSFTDAGGKAAADFAKKLGIDPMSLVGRGPSAR